MGHPTTALARFLDPDPDLAADMARDFWQASDKLGELSNLQEVKPIDRPQRVTVQVARLTRIWPDCKLCGLSVNNCECGPDDYAGALREVFHA